MNEEEIEKIIEMTINKSNKEYINLKKQFDELLSDYIELSRIEEKQEKVIEEVREYIEDSCYYPELENYSNMTSEEVKELVQILDKAKENK